MAVRDEQFTTAQHSGRTAIAMVIRNHSRERLHGPTNLRMILSQEGGKARVWWV